MKYLIIFILLCGCLPILQLKPTASTFSMDVADEFVGMNERTHREELKEFMGVDPVRYEWCAAFVNAVLNIQGIPGSESVSEYPLLARSFLTWGEEVTDELKPGDIIVFPRGREGWQGHVGFYVRTKYVDGVKYYLILGGNQDNGVTYELFPARFMIAQRRYVDLSTAASSP
jgi:uncharacterized protein (TIGR02594 family)